jgi:hypothetical protein
LWGTMGKSEREVTEGGGGLQGSFYRGKLGVICKDS